jgi:tRNA pseudouridine38-40 synthase
MPQIKEMMRYFVKLSFNGTAYHGWQMQENASSIQSKMVEALHFKAGVKEILTGCGRTDTGVHAKEFYAHFDLDQILDKAECEVLVFELNRFLPNDIAVQSLFPVKSEAHARFSAITRTYKYYISKKKDPFYYDFAWYIYGDLDIELMNEMANLLLSCNDFASFSKLHSNAKTNICRIFYSKWNEDSGNLVFTITADRFLRNMVRALVGTLIDVGKHKRTAKDFTRIIEGKNRSLAGLSAPAKGLFLHNVEYNWPEVLIGN